MLQIEIWAIHVSSQGRNITRNIKENKTSRASLVIKKYKSKKNKQRATIRNVQIFFKSACQINILIHGYGIDLSPAQWQQLDNKQKNLKIVYLDPEFLFLRIYPEETVRCTRRAVFENCPYSIVCTMKVGGREADAHQFKNDLINEANP